MGSPLSWLGTKRYPSSAFSPKPTYFEGIIWKKVSIPRRSQGVSDKCCMALARVDLPDEEQPFKNRIIFFPF
jgi:hypothetical protein